MKTDVTIPGPVLEAAEQAAEELGMSLSEFCAAALSAYVTTYQRNEVTAILNQVYENESSTIDPMLVKMQMASLNKEDW